jgi:hypothetical protein
MKHTVKKTAAFLLIFIMAAAIFGISASAAGSDGGSGNSSEFSVPALMEDVKEEFAEAAIVGTYFQQAFDFLEDNRGYHYIALGILALIICFFGYRLLRFFLLVVGFIGGCYGGFLLYPHVASWISGMPEFVELILAGVFGIAAAILIHFLFRLAIVVGVGYGVFVLSEAYFVEMDNALLYRIIAAVVVAIVAALLIKVVFVLATALGGGVLALTKLCSGVSAMQTVLYENEAVFAYLKPIGISSLTISVAVGLVIGLLGILFQFANTRRRRA